MLECQNPLFALDLGVTYLNAASSSPLPVAVRQAGAAGVAMKVKPWRRDPGAAERVVEETRRAAAALIGAEADDIAIVGSVSYGVAVVCANTTMEPGARILMLAGEHTSLALSWAAFARDRGCTVEAVAPPADGDWTEAILAAIDRPGAPPMGIAALTPVFWNDGALIALERIAPMLRRRGVPLLIDATQALGVMPTDVRRLQPDFMVFPSYKWLLGPYGLAFLYVAPHRQDGCPLEHCIGNHDGGADGLPYLHGARRFDRGERDSYITIPMAGAGLRVVAELGVPAIGERLRALTDRLADALPGLPVRLVPREERAPHILGLRFAPGPTQALVDRMAADGIVVSLRGDALRVSPHVYNDEADMDRCAAWLTAFLRCPVPSP